MSIDVSITPGITNGPELKAKGKEKLPFGESQYDGMEITDIKMACKDSNAAHKDFEPDGRPEADDKHKDCNCTCWLTGVEIKTKFTLRLNPDRIKGGYISAKPPYKSYDKEEPGALKVDEESVKVHERAHCDYLDKKIQEKIKKALEDISKTLLANCKCGESTKCKDELKKQVQKQLDAIAKQVSDDMTEGLAEPEEDSSKKYQDYLTSENEQNSRKKQVEYLENEAKAKGK